MFFGDDIDLLVRVFDDRCVLLYHACQYQDFLSYLAIGGIPSRALLSSRRLPFTPFDTDAQDRTNGVWDKVFVNLDDFGRTFASGGAGVPNPYGPILLLLNPEALAECEDVAICLRSAGGRDFDRESESLNTIEEVHRLFRSGDRLKWRDELATEFDQPGASAPEVSCTVACGVLSLRYVRFVRVDAYVTEGGFLLDVVKSALERFGHPEFAILRYDRDGRYSAIAEYVRQNATLGQIAAEGAPLSGWARAVSDRQLEYQYSRFARYLQSGTFEPLRALGEQIVRAAQEREQLIVVDEIEMTR